MGGKQEQNVVDNHRTLGQDCGTVSINKHTNCVRYCSTVNNKQDPHCLG